MFEAFQLVELLSSLSMLLEDLSLMSVHDESTAFWTRTITGKGLAQHYMKAQSHQADVHSTRKALRNTWHESSHCDFTVKVASPA